MSPPKSRLWTGRPSGPGAPRQEEQIPKRPGRADRDRSTPGARTSAPPSAPQAADPHWDALPDALTPPPPAEVLTPAPPSAPGRPAAAVPPPPPIPTARPAQRRTAPPRTPAPRSRADTADLRARTAPPRPQGTPHDDEPRSVPASPRGGPPAGAAAPRASARLAAARSRVSRRGLVAIAALVGVVLAGAAFLIAWPDSPATHTFHVTGEPTGIAADGGLVWVASPAAGVVSVLDGEGRPTARPMPTGGTPARIALGPQWAWVADTERGAVVGLPRAGGQAARRIRAGSDVADVAVAGGQVWTVSSADGGVRVLDGERARLVASGVRPMALAADSRRVVAVDPGAGTLLRLRPAGASVRIGGTPADVAIAGNSAWVTDPAAGTVRRVDLARGVPAGPPIRVGRAPVAVAADTRAVYVLCRGDRTLVRIDPASGKVRERLTLEGRPAALALAADRVWIAAGPNEVIRVDR